MVYFRECKRRTCFIRNLRGSDIAVAVCFFSDAIVVDTKLSTSYADNISIPAFKIDNHIVGATAMMLSELKEVLKEVLEPLIEV
jgi:hypothetical protein